MRPRLIFLVGIARGGMSIAWPLIGAGKTTPLPKPKLTFSIKPQHVADALRTVILSDREVYTQAVRNQGGSFPGGTNLTIAGKTLPAPCQLLRLGSQEAASRGVEYSYVLRSLEPANKRNRPETDAESKGLQFVATRPDLTYADEELLGGRWYFTAVYPDVASGSECITCHNALTPARPQPFKVGDVLGGLVVRIALEL